MIYQFLFIFCATKTIFSAQLKETAPRLNFDSRIIGGAPAYVGQFPFSAAIYVQTTDSKFFCGGTLINNIWIITSGHCVYNAVLFTIRLGSIYLDSDPTTLQTLATSTSVLHPEFNPITIENDIGLIRFREPVTFNAFVMSLSLPETNLEDGTSVYVQGWGQTSDNEAELSTNLRYIVITSISNLECKMFYGDQITDNMVCVIGNYNEGSCTGDNGSGLVTHHGKYYNLVGIASFISSNGCESTNPSGYTRTAPYVKWIKNVTST